MILYGYIFLSGHIRFRLMSGSICITRPQLSSTVAHIHCISVTTTRKADTGIFPFSVLENSPFYENWKLTVFICKWNWVAWKRLFFVYKILYFGGTNENLQYYIIDWKFRKENDKDRRDQWKCLEFSILLLCFWIMAITIYFNTNGKRITA